MWLAMDREIGRRARGRPPLPLPWPPRPQEGSGVPAAWPLGAPPFVRSFVRLFPSARPERPGAWNHLRGFPAHIWMDGKEHDAYIPISEEHRGIHQNKCPSGNIFEYLSLHTLWAWHACHLRAGRGQALPLVRACDSGAPRGCRRPPNFKIGNKHENLINPVKARGKITTSVYGQYNISLGTHNKDNGFFNRPWNETNWKRKSKKVQEFECCCRQGSACMRDATAAVPVSPDDKEIYIYITCMNVNVDYWILDNKIYKHEAAGSRPPGVFSPTPPSHSHPPPPTPAAAAVSFMCLFLDKQSN